MTDNEMQSIDLVVGPLDNFDDAVAFGDALYGLDGVTRLALNEFEGSRASFTFTARSLESVTESLTRMSDFAIGSVERAVDGTLQVRLAGAAPAAGPAFDEPAVPSPPEPQRQEASPEPSADPFVPAPRFSEPVVSEDSWQPMAEPVAEPPFEAPAPAEMFSPEPAALSGDFDQASVETMPPPVADEEFSEPAAGWPVDEQQATAAEPTPLYPPSETAFAAVTGAAEDDPNSEVAKVIEKLASELRETAEHLTQLAAGLTPAGEPAAAPVAEEQSPWREAAVEASEATWDGDLPTNQETPKEYNLPPAMTPEELDAISAEQSWDETPQPAPASWAAEPTVETPQPAPSSWTAEPAAETPQPAPEDEEKAWEAPRMPAIGAMAPIGGQGAPGEATTGAHNAQTIALATASGRRPSQVQLMASGFASFGIANSFIAAVRQIAGVRNVAIIELDQGRLKLTLDYFGSESLETQLHQLRDFPHQVVRASAKEIEIQLMAA